jgi:predicted RNase H-like nuclease (RuvC/YqgF family)
MWRDLILLAAGGGTIAAIIGWLSNRPKIRADALKATAEAKRVAAETEKTNTEIALEMRDKLANELAHCEQRVTELQKELDKLKTENARLRQQLEQLTQ